MCRFRGNRKTLRGRKNNVKGVEGIDLHDLLFSIVSVPVVVFSGDVQGDNFIRQAAVSSVLIQFSKAWLNQYGG